VTSVHAAPAEMVGEPGSISAADKLFQAAKMISVERFSRAKVHGNAVLYYAIALQNLVQYLKLAATFYHVIFRDDFKPVDDRLVLKNMLVMRNAQPDSYAEVFVSV